MGISSGKHLATRRVRASGKSTRQMSRCDRFRRASCANRCLQAARNEISTSAQNMQGAIAPCLSLSASCFSVRISVRRTRGISRLSCFSSCAMRLLTARAFDPAANSQQAAPLTRVGARQRTIREHARIQQADGTTANEQHTCAVRNHDCEPRRVF